MAAATPLTAAEVSAPPLSVRGLAAGNAGRVVVADVDLDLGKGSCTVLVGANGSGKSTLLRTVAGLQPPFAGTVTLAGRDLAHLRPRDAARTVTFLPQSPLVPSGISVRDLVLFGRHPHRRVFGGLTSDDRDAIDWALTTTQMADFADRSVDRLSGGERQRAWLAVALAQQTPVVLLDEPTTFLDIRFQLDVLRIIRTLVDVHDLAVGVVLHDLNQAAVVADQLVVLAEGQVIAAGAPADVLTPAIVRRAFAVEADIDVDPDTGAPRCRFHLDDTRSSPPSSVAPPAATDRHLSPMETLP